MRILVIGGTGLTGPFIVAGLAEAGHDVTVFNRGQSSAGLPGGVERIVGDTASLAGHKSTFERLSPDVVVHMMALTRDDAQAFCATFEGIAGRAVVISSADVYLAFGRLHGTEPGPLEPVPLREDSPLRRRPGLGGEAYDKIGVEEVLRDSRLPATIIRYPAVYGPGDSQRRFDAWAKRMAAGRPEIVIGESEATNRFAHGYSEDVARAVVLACLDSRAAGRTYNVAEQETPSTKDRIARLAAVAGWHGEVVVVPDADLPAHLRMDLSHIPGYVGPPDFAQHMVLDTAAIRADLGYTEVVPVEEGLRHTFEWLRSTGAEASQRVE